MPIVFNPAAAALVALGVAVGLGVSKSIGPHQGVVIGVALAGLLDVILRLRRHPRDFSSRMLSPNAGGHVMLLPVWVVVVASAVVLFYFRHELLGEDESAAEAQPREPTAERPSNAPPPLDPAAQRYRSGDVEGGDCGAGAMFAYTDAKGSVVIVDSVLRVPSSQRSTARCVR